MHAVVVIVAGWDRCLLIDKLFCYRHSRRADKVGINKMGGQQ